MPRTSKRTKQIGDIWRWQGPLDGESENLLITGYGRTPNHYHVIILENGQKVKDVRVGLDGFAWSKVA